jgi:hypothetical protein
MARREESTVPAFLGIGAQRAGTGWLYRNLENHPGIWVTPVKELHYFDTLNARQSLGTRLSKLARRAPARRLLRDCVACSHGSLRWHLRYYLGERNDEWYASLFSPAGTRKAGEVTPAYSILDSDTVRHIRNLVPEARIIFIMRDPLHRAWSSAINRLVGLRKLRFENIEEEQFIKEIDDEDSELRTAYMQTIRTWERHFPASQIFYGFYDDIVERPESLIESIYSFLQVDPRRALSNDMPRSSVKSPMGSRYQIPLKVQIYALEKYYGLLTELSMRFGNHADAWLATARSILEAAGRPLPLASSDPDDGA